MTLAMTAAINPPAQRGLRSSLAIAIVEVVVIVLALAAARSADARPDRKPRAVARGHTATADADLAAALAPVPIAASRSRRQRAIDRTIERHEWTAQYYVMRDNDLGAAAREYEAVLRLDRKRMSAGLALAAIYQRAGKGARALSTLRMLAKRHAASASVWVALAEVQGIQSDRSGESASIRKAVALAPGDPEVLAAHLAFAIRRFRGGEQAIKDELLAAATAYLAAPRQLGSFTTAAQRIVVELSDDPVAVVVFDAKAAYAAAFESGRMTSINEKMAEARQGFERCVAEQPNRQECHYHLGLVYSSVKSSSAYDPVKALAEFGKAPGLALAAVESARLWRLRDRSGEARTALQQALRLQPGLGVALIELAILDKLDGKEDDAVANLVAVVERSGDRAAADRAITELGKLRPTHPIVVQASVFGGAQGDVFSSERFKSAVSVVEQALGGVEKDAPELAILEDIVARLAIAAGVGTTLNLRVAILGSTAVNALAMPNGKVYVTRGMIDFLQRTWPTRAIDRNHDALGHILAHELAHVLRRHTVQSAIFREAVKDASQALDPVLLTHVGRLQEIEADRDGIVIASLAGFHPRGGIELMERLGKERELPQHLDHPTFEERISFLQEYWSNDVRYAYVSFGLGVAAMGKAAALEDVDLAASVVEYERAVEHFARFRTTLPTQREGLNNLGIAYAKLGVLALGKSDTPLGRWRTRFSIERSSASQYVGLVRDESDDGATRGGAGKVRMPWQLRESITLFKEALSSDEGYGKARLNLATAYLAGGRLDEATATLAKLTAGRGVSAGEIDGLRGVVLAEQGALEPAQAAFAAASTGSASAAVAAFNTARVLELRGKKPEAKAAYQAYLTAYPKGAWAAAAQAARSKL